MGLKSDSINLLILPGRLQGDELSATVEALRRPRSSSAIRNCMLKSHTVISIRLINKFWLVFIGPGFVEDEIWSKCRGG